MGHKAKLARKFGMGFSGKEGKKWNTPPHLSLLSHDSLMLHFSLCCYSWWKAACWTPTCSGSLINVKPSWGAGRYLAKEPLISSNLSLAPKQSPDWVVLALHQAQKPTSQHCSNASSSPVPAVKPRSCSLPQCLIFYFICFPLGPDPLLAFPNDVLLWS